MSLNFEQLETGKSYVFRPSGWAATEFAATFIALDVDAPLGLIINLLVRDIETDVEAKVSVYGQYVEVLPLTREWLEARMAGHAATVIDLHARCSNLLNARKVL